MLPGRHLYEPSTSSPHLSPIANLKRQTSLAKAGTAKHRNDVISFFIRLPTVITMCQKRHYTQEYTTGVFIGMRIDNIGVKATQNLVIGMLG